MLIYVRNELSTKGGGGQNHNPNSFGKLETTKQHDPKEVLCYGRKAKKLHGSQGLCPVTKNFTARREG